MKLFNKKVTPLLFQWKVQEVKLAESSIESYSKSDGVTNNKIPGCIFSEILIFENGRFAANSRIF